MEWSLIWLQPHIKNPWQWSLIWLQPHVRNPWQENMDWYVFLLLLFWGFFLMETKNLLDYIAYNYKPINYCLLIICLQINYQPTILQSYW
jgi:hypothetical protein